MSTRQHIADTRSCASVATVPAHVDEVAVSFVIVTFGTGPVVVDAVSSVVESMIDTDLAYEVVVVDNAHPSAAHRSRNELALSTSGVRIITPGRNLGFGAGCELGALHASGHILVFINPDLVVPAGWVQPLLERLDAGASIVAPVLLNPDGTVQEAGSVVYSDGSTSPITSVSDQTDTDQRPDYASAACWLIRREDHERLGGFDPAFHPAFYEDVDYAFRAARAGDRLEVVAASTVVHHRGMGTHGSSRTTDTSDQRDVLLARHPEIRWRQPVRPAVVR